MAQTRRFAVAITLFFLAFPGWATPANPALMATPPQPKWSDLSVPQKIVLAPLSDDWDSMENYRQKKWLSIASRFFEMTVDEQRRVQIQMQSWDKLSPEERRTARENYKSASQLSSERKQQLKQKWEEYSNLPDAEKEKLKQLAESQASAKPVRPAITPVQTNLPAPPTPPAPSVPDESSGNAEAPTKQ
mgnify:CR=1 FL=1